MVGTLCLGLALAATGCSADGEENTETGATTDLAQAGGGAEKAPAEAAKTAAGEENPLMNPDSEAMKEKAPSEYRVHFETSAGEFEIDVTRAWAPRGADRFYNLVRHGFYDGVRFFRVVDNFMVQFGINGDPALTNVWANTKMLDDPVEMSNQRGYITYAKTGAPHSRSTQVFINFKDNSFLDSQGFAPFGQVVGDGMKVVDAIYSGYGEGAPRGQGPSQGRITAEGNAYLEKEFPKLDYIEKATIVEMPAE
jgi:peptidyl-prolyl cis-trans isomerase A (cyclophilin A)